MSQALLCLAKRPWCPLPCYFRTVVLPWHTVTDTGNGMLHCDTVALTLGNGETKLFVRFLIFSWTMDSEWLQGCYLLMDVFALLKFHFLGGRTPWQHPISWMKSWALLPYYTELFAGRRTPFIMSGRMQKIVLVVALLHLQQMRDMCSTFVPCYRNSAARYAAITAESQQSGFGGLGIACCL